MKKLSELIKSKIAQKEQRESKGIKNPYLDAEIDRLIDVYFNIKNENESYDEIKQNPIQVILHMKRLEDEIDFIINKDFSLGMAVKKYTEKSIENLKLTNVIN